MKKMRCSNCGKSVKYGSQHMRGNDELNAYWLCKPPAPFHPRPITRQNTDTKNVKED